MSDKELMKIDNIEIINESKGKETQYDFNEAIKVKDFEKIENSNEKETFIKDLTENRENLYLLSIERLEKIVKYNEEIIKKNENIIKKLKNN